MRAIFIAAALSVALVQSVALLAQSNVPELAFDANTDVVRTPPNIYIGEVAGVGRTSQGRIFVYTRTGHPYATLGDNRTFYRGGSRLFEFDASGKFVRELGQDVYGFNTAFGLRIDPQDNVWTIDQSASQVVKFDREGRLLLVLGRKPEAINVRPAGAGGAPAGEEGGGGGRAGGGRAGGAPAPPPGSGIPGSTFSQPTDVAWDRAGNIYVADGVTMGGGNARIAKFDKDGHFIKSWGFRGSEPGQFNSLRGIAIDAQGNVYVADAGNKRIQVFDGEGTPKAQITNIGTPSAICMTTGSHQYLYSSNSNDPDTLDNGEIYKLELDGRVVGTFGRAGRLAKEFGTVNAIDCRSENELFVGELLNWRVQKLTLRAPR
jgi:hypothetical protein